MNYIHIRFAHLDIRLLNICVTGTGVVTLIDLDQCGFAEAICKRGTSYHDASDMYRQGKFPWTNKNVDFRCVGLIICFVLDDQVQAKDYHVILSENKVDQRFTQDCFIKNLLKEGEWDVAAYATFCQTYVDLNGRIPIQ